MAEKGINETISATATVNDYPTTKDADTLGRAPEAYEDARWWRAGITDTSVGATPGRHAGNIGFSIGADLIFERIWVSPVFINPNFIVEDLEYDVEIWNAYQHDAKTWTAESKTGVQTGTLWDHPTLPVVIPQSADRTDIMYIYASGPALQDTTHTATIGGEDYDVLVQGLRVISLEPEANWQVQVQLSYYFETAMSRSERLVEQRRPLTGRMRRILSMELTVNSLEAQRVISLLSYGKDKAFACPIYHERILASTLPQSGLTAGTTTHLTPLWNLNNLCDVVLIMDPYDLMTELKEIDSVASYEITFAKKIEQAFDTSTSMLFPCFIGLLQAVKMVHLSDDVHRIRVDFKEFISG